MVVNGTDKSLVSGLRHTDRIPLLPRINPTYRHLLAMANKRQRKTPNLTSKTVEVTLNSAHKDLHFKHVAGKHYSLYY